MNITNCKLLLKLTCIIKVDDGDNDFKLLIENCQKQIIKLQEIEKYVLEAEKKLTINHLEICEKWSIYCESVNQVIESMNLSSSQQKNG